VFRAKSFAIGIVHGLAGSSAIMIALLPEIQSVPAGIGYIVLFSIGTMLSMAALTLLLALPLKASAAKQALNRAITIGAGALSFAVGVALIAEIMLGTSVMPL
jgi:hypothetical protein